MRTKIKVEKGRKRKSTEMEKANYRKRKYATINDNSLSAWRAYLRHDDGELPQDVYHDVSPEHLKNEECLL